MPCNWIAPKTDERRVHLLALPATMRFWDASAIIPLLADEPTREHLLQLIEEDAEILAWWGTPTEIASALARREREGLIKADDVTEALRIAHSLAESWHEIIPSDSVRRTAERLLRTHPLRAADSLQLAAALIASDHNPVSLEFVCLDARLVSAARREGFSVLGQ
jgi:predicted nucleic acid-binding protein